MTSALSSDAGNTVNVLLFVVIPVVAARSPWNATV